MNTSCNEEGHFARECPSEPENDGNCRVCGQEGHFAKECPDKKEPGPCRKYAERLSPSSNSANTISCGEEGHRAAECEAPRMLSYEGIPDLTTDKAWQMMVTASGERDIDDFKMATRAYLKSDRAATFADLDSRCREAKLSIYFIALVGLPSSTQSNYC